MSDESGIKVGDKVRLLDGTHEAAGHRVGDIATVVAAYDIPKGSIDVLVGTPQEKVGESYYYTRREYEKVSEEPKVQTIEETVKKNTLPFEVWVGDMLLAAFATQELRAATIGTIRDNVIVWTRENFG